MTADRDKFLSVHRSQVQSSFWGTMSVLNSFLIFTGLDLIFLGYHWFLHFMACRMYACGTFRNELIINSVFTLVPVLSLIPCSFFFYVATLIMVGLVMFNMVRLLFGGRIKVWFIYCDSFLLFASSVPTALMRLFLAFTSLWLCLVLHSIRLAGGKGTEFKSAEELELEATAYTQSTGSECDKMLELV
ncbi:conserved hypothetical protein [Theileria orientalis strain Shintoku]|uniref:Transmembrane protein n=1 Tax=Theileria orientalis strain Shintoku TaxID=869250 RepID=J4D7F1_THEOR|nr:conserved hypothetical protein [Theileria orientalis strain Shintoku]BAM40145.1 conserved hypothetical protein [Theileria orientalis strain Shintoku]|eukprot:XP_009690446.1 conserved hypothetical protein [Theileria orientalis strain Shintoku]